MTTRDDQMQPQPPAPPPRLEWLETRWRVKGPGGRELTCGIFLGEAGYDVRAEYAADDVMRSQWARDVDAARRIADRWLEEIRQMDGFEELPGS
jgi:hypothetical protein